MMTILLMTTTMIIYGSAPVLGAIVVYIWQRGKIKSYQELQHGKITIHLNGGERGRIDRVIINEAVDQQRAKGKKVRTEEK